LVNQIVHAEYVCLAFCYLNEGISHLSVFLKRNQKKFIPSFDFPFLSYPVENARSEEVTFNERNWLISLPHGKKSSFNEILME